jgi:outer membrane lipopolysaccharide assembly protein LptE/RlpB
MKKLVAAVLTLAMSMTLLTACGGGLQGTYKLVGLESNGQMVGEDMLELMNLKDLMTLEFTSNSEVEVRTAGAPTEYASYSISGSSITIKDSTASITGTLEGNLIILDVEGVRMIFEQI